MMLGLTPRERSELRIEKVQMLFQYGGYMMDIVDGELSRIDPAGSDLRIARSTPYHQQDHRGLDRIFLSNSDIAIEARRIVYHIRSESKSRRPERNLYDKSGRALEIYETRTDQGILRIVVGTRPTAGTIGSELCNIHMTSGFHGHYDVGAVYHVFNMVQYLCDEYHKGNDFATALLSRCTLSWDVIVRPELLHTVKSKIIDKSSDESFLYGTEYGWAKRVNPPQSLSEKPSKHVVHLSIMKSVSYSPKWAVLDDGSKNGPVGNISPEDVSRLTAYEGISVEAGRVINAGRTSDQVKQSSCFPNLESDIFVVLMLGQYINHEELWRSTLGIVERVSRSSDSTDDRCKIVTY